MREGANIRKEIYTAIRENGGKNVKNKLFKFNHQIVRGSRTMPSMKRKRRTS